MSKVDFAKLAAAMQKAVGENAETQDVTQFLTTGYIELDNAISGKLEGGGLPVGRVVEIFGPPSSGKTAIATQAMIAAQRMGGVAGFCDHERSFKKALAIKMGLSEEEGQWFIRKPKTFEESFDYFKTSIATIRGFLPREYPIVWVFDSLAAMVPRVLLEKAAADVKMNDKLALAACTSLFFPAISQIAEDENVCVIFLNQIRLNPGVIYGNPEKTTGGNAPPFYCSVRIQLGARKVEKGQGEDKVVVGSEITARVVKNKINRPFLKAKWQFRFREDGTGYFDVIGALVDLLVEREVLKSKGGRIEWTDGKQYFRDPLVTALNKLPNAQAHLEKMVIANGIVAEVDTEAEAQANEDVVEAA